jgi:predicted nuclease of predicted toxin-antitoxin system
MHWSRPVRVCLDENMPLRLWFVLDGHEVSSVRSEGWAGKSNGELLNLLADRFDVLVTSDQSIGHQQNLIGRNISVVVVPTNNLTILRANAIALRVTLDELAGHSNAVLVTIDWRGRRTIRGLSRTDEEAKELPPMPRF